MGTINRDLKKLLRIDHINKNRSPIKGIRFLLIVLSFLIVPAVLAEADHKDDLDIP